ncbi:hypothetical protein BKK79_27070 [Cupriavidus sp. USMAA2-4]|uniref:hypothetical protein n=1 Tax=Cupriavidus sp. USMAA2-4 TaxID=876364 RepID=UPI0008A67433|nr:hypothetical protein [Cupriavidus sp. USMAA2-4]AOY95430.1 hypothetical protein BKK79_27070 [Cupriavidus sp. USMAA2-4]
MNRVHAKSVVCGLMLACLSAACVSTTGVKVEPEQLANFIPGFSTLDDVTGQLGTPTSQATLGDGSTVLVYSFATAKPHAESLIPLIGPLFSGNDIQSSTVLFEFDQNGVLRSQRKSGSSGTSGLTVLPHRRDGQD